jgi:hypothetical protein
LNIALDKGIKLLEVFDKTRREVEVHVCHG